MMRKCRARVDPWRWLPDGSANLGIYDGSEYAKHADLVVVGINYRIGPLGFLHGLGDTNVWLSDQVAALRWVSDNIGAFGGDPERVTLVGQSGGGFSIGALAGHPQTSRSFGRAILQSPPLGRQLPTPDEALTRTRALADALGHATRSTCSPTATATDPGLDA